MGHIIAIVPIPFARNRAPEKVLTQSVPHFSRSLATNPLPAEEIMIGMRFSTLDRKLVRMCSVEIRFVITLFVGFVLGVFGRY